MRRGLDGENTCLIIVCGFGQKTNVLYVSKCGRVVSHLEFRGFNQTNAAFGCVPRHANKCFQNVVLLVVSHTEFCFYFLQ